MGLFEIKVLDGWPRYHNAGLDTPTPWLMFYLPGSYFDRFRPKCPECIWCLPVSCCPEGLFSRWNSCIPSRSIRLQALRISGRLTCPGLKSHNGKVGGQRWMLLWGTIDWDFVGCVSFDADEYKLKAEPFTGCPLEWCNKLNFDLLHFFYWGEVTNWQRFYFPCIAWRITTSNNSIQI